MKYFSFLIILLGSSLFCFSQEIEKFNKKELREFINYKLQEIDSVNNIVLQQKNKLIVESDFNKHLSLRIDSLLLILKNEKSKFNEEIEVIAQLSFRLKELEKSVEKYKQEKEISSKEILLLKVKLDSVNVLSRTTIFKSLLDLYKQIPAINRNEETNHRDLTYVYPIGWSIDDKFFAYFTSFSSGGTKFDFRVDQIDMPGQTRNISLIKCEMDCDIDDFLVSNNEKINQIIVAFGIKNNKDTILKNNSTLYREKGLYIDIKKIYSGHCEDYNLRRKVPKIGNLGISLSKNKQILSSYNLILSDNCDTDFQNIGYLESPNKKYIISLIEHWGVNGYEGYPEVGINLVCFPLNF